MIATEKPFAALTAEDLMTCPVEAIPQQMSLRDAARVLSRARITGAPVVDAAGRCVGVLSSTDFVRVAERGGEAYTVHCTRPLGVDSNWQVVDLEFLPNDEVGWHMTKDPVTATATARVTEIAYLMRRAHIHRVVILDEERRPVGIVSSSDILGAVASVHDSSSA
jgi:CBS domain-containing protein